MGTTTPSKKADKNGTDAHKTSIPEAEQALTQMPSETADDKSTTKRESPRALAGKNWQTFLDIAKKMTEYEHMALTALLHAEIQPDGSAVLSKLGKNAVNFYLNEGATLDKLPSMLALGNYRLKRAKHFFDKKSISEAKKESLQELLLDIAYDIPCIESTFWKLQNAAAEAAAQTAMADAQDAKAAEADAPKDDSKPAQETAQKQP